MKPKTPPHWLGLVWPANKNFRQELQGMVDILVPDGRLAAMLHEGD